MRTHNPQRNTNAPRNVLRKAPLTTVVPARPSKSNGKGREYIKISKNIEKITNFYQVEPTRELIDLFGKKYDDRVLQQELLNDLYEKAGEFAYYD